MGHRRSITDTHHGRPAGAAKDAINAAGRISAPRIEIKALTGGEIHAAQLEDGQRVRRGDLLVQFDDKVDAAQVAAAEADLRLKLVALKREEALYQELRAKGQSNSDIEEARANVDIAQAAIRYRQAELAQHRITAPFDGVIANARARAGQVVAGGEALATLVDLDHPAVEFSVTERDSTRIAPGARVTVTVPALERNFTGRVATVAAQVNPGTATVAVKATLDGPTEGLKPGMLARVAVEPGQPTTRDAGK